MESHGSIGDDLGYVRSVVRGAGRTAFPPAIAYLWAAIGMVGFSLIDVAPRYVGVFWSIAAPAGFIVSAWLGWRHGRSLGQGSWHTGRPHVLHWGALLLTVFLLYPLIATGQLEGKTIAQVVLLIVAFAYFLGGLHLAPALRWAALAVALGYVVTLTIESFAWTILGILFAVGLVLTARASVENRGQQQA